MLVCNAQNLLYYLIQRYKFESNSQQLWTANIEKTGCIIWYKDTNLKAIHNSRPRTELSTAVVLSDTKIQIWKQFTTNSPSFNTWTKLYYLIQRYKFESNSQQLSQKFTPDHRCIIWYKDTNLKAIHNRDSRLVSSSSLYYLIQRYKFESNSQRDPEKVRRR